LDRELLEAAIRVAHEHKLRAVVHAGSIEEASEAVAAGADRLVHPPWLDVMQSDGFARTLRKHGVSIASTLSISSVSDEWEASHGRPGRYLPNVMANVRLLRRAGVSLAFGTDVPMRSVEDGLDLEMRLLQEAGLSQLEIIHSATRHAAAFLGILDQVGTLEPGKRADLMIVRGDPLETVTALRSVELVLRDGQVAFRADRSRDHE
jgi:imidazolonepropionase-like amidohydrolase